MSFAHVRTTVEAEHVGAPPRELVDRRLRSGARLLVLPTAGRKPTHAQRRGPVSIQLWVLAGTSSEVETEHGCAHLLEHMLFKPSVSASGGPVDIASAIESLGGDVNAYTSHDETVFHATVPGTSVDLALDALVRPIVAPILDPDELARERQVVLEEIKQYDDDPQSRAAQELLLALYGGHSYARPVLGRRAEILSHTRSVVRQFHRRNYVASRMALVVVGPVNPTAIARRVESLFAGIPRGGRVRREAKPVAPNSASIRIRTGDVHEAHVILGWQAPSLLELEGCAMEVAAVVLGHGEASWLATQTRRRQRLVTDAVASLYAARQACTFMVSAHMPAAQVEVALNGLLEQIGRLRRVPLDAEELRRASALLESDVVYRRETVNGMAHALGYQLSLTGDLKAEKRYFETLRSLTPEAVRTACQRVLRPEMGSLSIIVPRRGDSRSIRRLRNRARALMRSPRPLEGAKRGGRSVRLRRGIWTADLENGVRVRALVNRTVPMAAGWMVWPGGLRMERAREIGASPLVAALLTRGTSSRDGDTLAREIDGLAAVLDGFSGRNSLGLHFECLARDLSTIVRRAVECVLDATFAKRDFEEERRVALEELHAEQDDVATLAFRAAYEELYRGHPFRWRRRGTKKTLESFSARQLRALWERDYPPERMVVGLAGDLDPEKVAELLASLVERRSARTDSGRSMGDPPRHPTRSRFRWIRRDREQAHVVVAYPGLTLADPRTATLDVLVTILGGQSGRLFASLREEQGLVYHVSVSSMEGVDAGHLVFHGATSQEKLDVAMEAIAREMDAITLAVPKANELDRAKSWLIGQHEASMQRRGRVASQMAFDEAYGLGAAAFETYPERVAAVDGKQVLSLAQSLISKSSRVTAVVSSRKPARLTRG